MSLGLRALAILGLTIFLAACSRPQRAPSCPSSSPAGALEGEVVDATTNRQLTGVTVVAVASAAPQPVIAQTDQRGRYQMCGLTPGTYTVTFFYEDITIERTGIDIGAETFRYPTVRVNKQNHPTRVQVAVPLWDEAMSRDCTPPTLVNKQISSSATTDCGVIDARRRPTSRDEAARRHDAVEQAKQCVADALANGREFSFSEMAMGIDSEGGLGYFAVRDNGMLRVFEVFYDSDPCGGSCPWDGGATIRECKALLPTTSAKRCGHTLVGCFECRDAVEVQRCRRGEKPITRH